MKRPILLAALLLTATAGCTMAPKYTRPEAEVPVAFPEGAAYPDTTGWADLPAATDVAPAGLYPDLRLQQVVDLALARNLDLRLAALNVERVRAMYKITGAAMLPSLTASASGSRSQTPGDLSATGATSIDSRYGVDVGVASWEIDLFGRLRSEKNQAMEQYLASEEGRRGAELSLVSAVGQAYLKLAATREQLALARSTLAAQQEAFALVQRQYDVGAASALDLSRAQTQVSAAEVDIASYTRQEAQDRNALDLLAGGPVPEALLPADLAAVAPPADVAPGLSSAVLLGRPDVMAAEHQLMAANAQIGVARAAFFPRISLTALVGTASAALSGLFASGSDTWAFRPTATMPIFDLRTTGALKLTQAEREIVLARYQQTIQTAFREVSDALATKGTIRQQVDAQARLVDATSTAYDLAQLRYRSGADSYLGVLDAQRSMYAARQGLVGLKLAEAANKVQLYAVLGGGGTAAAPDQAQQ
ncbi:MAG TPA: efflux transporter outer membrane subunit [Candidatus Krumholzibacteria bacterium]|nr:efflux transporter outer membrane subunit [Candidatus Krumholzibacteria bacterium]